MEFTECHVNQISSLLTLKPGLCLKLTTFTPVLYPQNHVFLNTHEVRNRHVEFLEVESTLIYIYFELEERPTVFYQCRTPSIV